MWYGVIGICSHCNCFIFSDEGIVMIDGKEYCVDCDDLYEFKKKNKKDNRISRR